MLTSYCTYQTPEDEIMVRLKACTKVRHSKIHKVWFSEIHAIRRMCRPHQFAIGTSIFSCVYFTSFLARIKKMNSHPDEGPVLLHGGRVLSREIDSKFNRGVCIRYIFTIGMSHVLRTHLSKQRPLTGNLVTKRRRKATSYIFHGAKNPLLFDFPPLPPLITGLHTP